MWRQRSFKWTRKKPKYRNTVTTVGGIKYDSKSESKVGQDLEFQKKAGEIKDFECQVPIDLYANDFKICRYILDFKVYHNDGSIEWVEVKGYPTEVWRLKRKLFEAVYIEPRKETERYTVITK